MVPFVHGSNSRAIQPTIVIHGSFDHPKQLHIAILTHSHKKKVSERNSIHKQCTHIYHDLSSGHSVLSYVVGAACRWPFISTLCCSCVDSYCRKITKNMRKGRSMIFRAFLNEENENKPKHSHILYQVKSDV